MIYLISDGKYLKIGFTSNLDKRLKQYATHSNSIELIDYKEGDKEDESILHSHFSHYRLNTEWFEYSEDIIKGFRDYLNISKEIKIIPSKDYEEIFDIYEYKTFEQIFRLVSRLQNINSNSKIILAFIIVNYINMKECTISNRDFCDYCGIDCSTVIRCLKDLADSDFINTENIKYKNSNKVFKRRITPNIKVITKESIKTFNSFKYIEE